MIDNRTPKASWRVSVTSHYQVKEITNPQLWLMRARKEFRSLNRPLDPNDDFYPHSTLLDDMSMITFLITTTCSCCVVAMAISSVFFRSIDCKIKLNLSETETIENNSASRARKISGILD